MANIRSKGTLTRWLDDKGFGFITPEKGKQEIFVHISAFDRDLPRRPETGDTIFYYPQKDENGKIKAVAAVIEGVAPVARNSPSRVKPCRKDHGFGSSWKLLGLCIVLIIGGGTTVYERLRSRSDSLIPDGSQAFNAFTTPQSANQSSGYTCAGKTRCNQMTSCEEATFYLRNCPGTIMDGDGDGVPCEDQHCN